MSNIRDLGNKINSLQNMQKVMRAMNMIASIKLRKLISVQESLALFDKSIEIIRSDIFSALQESEHPLAEGYSRIKRIHIVLFTADKGLCGSHNSSVQKAAAALAEEHQKKGTQVEFSCIGNKGAHFCGRKEYEIFQQAEINERVFNREELKKISSSIFTRFLDNQVQKIYAVGNIFHSTLFQETATLQLLPFFQSRDSAAEKAGSQTPGSSELRYMETEPSGDALALSAGELYLFYKLNSLLMNSYLSEHSSRMTAMENANNNSEDLVNKYITMQNHARQASITNELIEIVSGKEAMKG